MHLVQQHRHGIAFVDRRSLVLYLHFAITVQYVINFLQSRVPVPTFRCACQQQQVIHIGPVRQKDFRSQRAAILRRALAAVVDRYRP